MGKQAVSVHVKDVLQTSMHDKAPTLHTAIWQNIIFHVMYSTWIILQEDAETKSVDKLGDADKIFKAIHRLYFHR